MTPLFGAVPAERGYRFTVWAPEAQSVTLHVRRDAQSPVASYQMPVAGCQSPDPSCQAATGNREVATDNRQLETGNRKLATGLWQLVVPDARAGDRYAYSVDGNDPLPDPASRFQPDGVHGWSEIVDPRAFSWTDSGWRGVDPHRAVIYELHVGTFTPEGTFAAAAEKLPYLRDLGVTVVELMPLADFPGQRNWGYDGVALFAPSRAYGRPDDLRAFVDRAHGLGLGVLIDVVYNHLGPEGAYLPAFSPQFHTTGVPTPWGAAVNLDGPGSAQVRRLLIENAAHWVGEYHADGLRLDATHSLFDRGTPHLVAEIVEEVRRVSNGRALVFAEDARNQAALFDDMERGGWAVDGVWADDFHHVVRRLLAGDAHGHFEDFDGTTRELEAIFRQGWLYTGQHSKHWNKPRGSDASHVPLRKAVICIQNHDQVGNRAFGDRLHHTVDAATWRAATTLLLTAPMTPLLFMGQEWATSAPFQFFTDFHPDLGQNVVEGRRREFKAFPAFSSDEAAARIPSPQARSTFEASKLRWEEQGNGDFARTLALTRRLLALRAQDPALGGSDATSCDAEAVDDDTIAFVRDADGGRRLAFVVRLRGSGTVAPRALRGASWRVELDTEDAAFAGDSQPPRVDTASGAVTFARPGAVILSAQTA